MKKKRYLLFKRGNVFYVEDSLTKKQESLRTRSKAEALELVRAYNESVQKPELNLGLVRVYLSAHDPALPNRTWRDLMDRMKAKGKEQTQIRCAREFRGKWFDPIREKKLLETTADELLSVMERGTSSTNHYLRRLHNLAVGLGWLPWPILSPLLWPRIIKQKRRGITKEEHQRIIAHEFNRERKLFYELLWETGASQSDAANLRGENICWQTRVLRYHRMKLEGRDHGPASLRIGNRLESILDQLPKVGFLFPGIASSSNNHRAAEFRRRCRILKIDGVSLHSYRRAWAERAKVQGYPERWAKSALGHNSSAVHEAYAKGADVICPSLEEYEDRIVPLFHQHVG